MLKINPLRLWALHDSAATRAFEIAMQSSLPPHTLMQRAGLATARLALAMAPHARTIWIACGPGNNGGDGLEAALHLQQWGKQPIVTWLGQAQSAPLDAAQSFQRAVDAGVCFTDTVPAHWDLCIDALLGLGADVRPAQGRMAQWIAQMNASAAPVLAVDLPTGLQGDTGVCASAVVVAQQTLSLLTLKPGLFTGGGRDVAGEVWLDDLGAANHSLTPCSAWLAGRPEALVRPHASHKGSYGDVAVIGGAPGMVGAALLAATAALHAGAGRVFVGLLDGQAMAVDLTQPELMFRPVTTLDLSAMTTVCGCGAGMADPEIVEKVLSASAHVVIDADAINLIASNTQLQASLIARGQRAGNTVLTPHPLEAARLLNTSTGQLQSDRLTSAQRLAEKFNCVVVLKGSGSVVAGPQCVPVINPTGNALLASAGTGDVLAGIVGARLAGGLDAFDAACHAVYQHGLVADRWPIGTPLVASALAKQAHVRG
jgi:ADP-dependent NAD(P)H-hydrate dehydratase / NAD(P)H-hydrate epimerase